MGDSHDDEYFERSPRKREDKSEDEWKTTENGPKEEHHSKDSEEN